MDYVALSKELSYALRHAPGEYGLIVDEYGWVDLEQLLTSFRQRGWATLTCSDLENMIATSVKKRHEIVGDKIRAFYGHSVANKIKQKQLTPPAILYHGTARHYAEIILAQGLKPRQRNYVHLSADIETAIEVGRRRDSDPVILMIDSEQAFSDGVKFYLGNETIWLTDYIAPKYINIYSSHQ